jgi:hypothetical protein
MWTSRIARWWCGPGRGGKDRLLSQSLVPVLMRLGAAGRGLQSRHSRICCAGRRRRHVERPQVAGAKRTFLCSQARAQATQRLHAVAHEAGLPPTEWEPCVVEGDASLRIVENEQSHDCDLVVMGKHGQSATVGLNAAPPAAQRSAASLQGGRQRTASLAATEQRGACQHDRRDRRRDRQHDDDQPHVQA